MPCGIDDLEKALDDAGIGRWELHVASGLVSANASFARLIGSKAGLQHEAAFPRWMQEVHASDQALLRARHRELLEGGVGSYEMNFRVQRDNGAVAHLRLYAWLAERNPMGEAVRIAAILREDSCEPELERARDALRVALEQLAVAARLESVGELAASVAHEINTPAQYVSDSLHFIRDAASELLDHCDRSPPAVAEGKRDLAYIRRHLPEALDASVEGIDRIAEIVRSMKDFSGADRREMRAVDLNRTIQSTLVMARKQYKQVAEVKTHFADVPAVVCHSGDINQVMLNLISNAAHAIRDALRGPDDRGCITVTTRREETEVVITVADSGCGIPPAARARVFEPFFTTRAAGMGLGLSISRNIVRKHHGTLTFDTAVDGGTTFMIRLPLQPVT